MSVASNLDHLVSISGVWQDTVARANALIAEMGSNKAELVLGLERRLEELVHELECRFLVLEESTAVDVVQV